MGKQVLCVSLLLVVASAALVSAAVSDVEKDVLKWLNIARTEPLKMAAELEKMLPNFDAKTPMLYHIPGDPVGLLTNEGAAAVREAIAALKTVNGLPGNQKPGALLFANGLLNSAQDHAQDQGSNGVFSHTGTDASTPWSRVAKYGTWKVTAAENMGTGYNTGVDIVRQLLIDDGEPDRGHRKNILNPTLKNVGVAVRPHKVYDFVNVQDFTGDFTNKPGIREP